MIHGDANDYNILVDAAGARVTSILDFGDMVHTATVCDLAIALAYVMLDKQDPIAAAAPRWSPPITGAGPSPKPKSTRSTRWPPRASR